MKKFYFLPFAFLMVVSLLHGQVNLNQNLLLHYPFNGNANDVSGNNFHGSANATLTADRFGTPNSAYSFNGVDQYIDLPNQAALKPQLPLTFAFWVKFDNMTPQNTIIFRTNYTEDRYLGIWANLTGGRMAISYGDGDIGLTSSASRRSKIGTSILAINTWYHIVAVFRGPLDMDIYINCINDGGTYDGTGGPMVYDNNPGSLGRADVLGFAPYYFKGSLDEIRYWSRSLSAQEVSSLCNVTASFTGLKQSYCSNESPSQLVGTPSGGTFSGPGVNGNTFNPASAGEGTHQITYTIQTVTGAPVTSTQTTVVKLVKRAVFERVICKGESVTYAGQTFSNSGQYQITTTASNGCDSLIYLNLLVKDPSNTVIEASICQGQSYSYNGQNYSQAGEYVVSSQGAPACEKTILKLTVKPNKTAVFERVICEGESVSYGGKTFNTNGLHEVTIPASNGCDSLIRVYLTVTPASSSTIVRKICAGESVSFGGQSYNQTGIYLLQLPGTAPCHKTYLDLTVLPNNSAEYRRTICAGQSVTYGGETFNSNGVFIIETEAANGCDSTITLYLTVINGETSYVDAEICAGESYTLPNGNQVNQTGEYPVWVQGDNSNCGSTIITRLKVNPVYNKTVNASINQGETYQLPDGSFVSIAGEYKSNLKTITNCDSIITTKLSVVSPPPAGGCYAVLVKGFKQGNMKNGTPVPAIRSNPGKALFAPEPVVNGVVNFVSLGFGGEITLAFEGPVANGSGNDIRVHEATWNKRTCRNYPEEAEIFASQNGCDWIYIGKVCTNGGDLDLGPLSWAQYIKVKDITNKGFGGFPGSADAFDVNAIECLNGPGTIADDGLVAGSIQDVVDYQPGTMKNGGQLPPARKIPGQATGLPGGAGVNFVSLGFGGTFIGRFDYVVFNFAGADLKVLETSYGNPSCANYPEFAHFYGSKDGSTWVDLGVFCQDADIDLAPIDWIQYIKVVDESLILSGKFNGAADGYDLDGVATVQPCENSRIELELNDNVAEADEAYVLSVYPNPVTDHFNLMIEGLENDQTVIVQLTDASGRLVFEKQFSTRGKILSETILAENLPHGVYHLAIRTQGGVWIEKLVK